MEINYEKNLKGLINNLNLKEFTICQAEAENSKYKIFAKTEAMAIRIARVYFNLDGELWIWDEGKWNACYKAPTGYTIEPNIYTDV